MFSRPAEDVSEIHRGTRRPRRCFFPCLWSLDEDAGLLGFDVVCISLDGTKPSRTESPP
ncbi:hypothetical protein L798_11745 [Zootermopsis nevadensis]|uniref:Uncharacterized protein n=1 Tax=Zootermopsis nevadensis TaxID=136037 RepID=A0A067QYB1_ZOONE|nr:hypothetical protein L798_11745 [Zootermopsis nevadensis]